jgi:multidrug efflux pump
LACARIRNSFTSKFQQRLERRIAAEVPEARVQMFGPPPLQGLGNASGFRIMVEDRGDLGLDALQMQTDMLVEAARKSPMISQAFTSFTVKYPQVFVNINRDQVHTMGLNLADVENALQIYLGSIYVNDFNLFGRTWQVVVQAEARFRDNLEAIRQLKVRNAVGNMAPLGTVADVRLQNGPLVVPRYNLYPSAAVMGAWPPGVSSGDAIAAFQALASEKLPTGMTTEWTEISYLQLIAENTGMKIFGYAVLLVFLVLAAQYESWSLPLAIILVVPMCLLSATAGVWISRLFAATIPGQPSEINIFTQIGFVVLVGLASKNAVLIVEFAKHKLESGLSIREATLEACRLRLRPILMTSFAFILGVVPLVVAKGAGMEMRRALGVAVFSGMLGVTIFGVFLTPVFFAVIEWLSKTWMFASPAVQKVGNVLLDILTLGFLRDFMMRPMRRRITAAQAPVDSLDPELVEMGTFVAERPPREEPVNELSPEAPPTGEKMVVVDHQRGKTDIIVVQQIVVAPPPAAASPPSSSLAASENGSNGHHTNGEPLIPELVDTLHEGGPAMMTSEPKKEK